MKASYEPEHEADDNVWTWPDVDTTEGGHLCGATAPDQEEEGADAPAREEAGASRVPTEKAAQEKETSLAEEGTHVQNPPGGKATNDDDDEDIVPKPKKRPRTHTTCGQIRLVARNPPGTGVKKIMVYTIGLDDLGLDDRFDQCSSFDIKILAAFKKGWDEHGQPNQLIDARLFDSPRPLTLAQGHSGEHEDMIRTIVQDRCFVIWLQALKREFIEKEQEHNEDKPYIILVYCKAGVRRSVGASAVLRKIFSRAGYSVAGGHLSGATKFSKICHGKCARCYFGKCASETKKEQLRLAVGKWFYA